MRTDFRYRSFDINEIFEQRLYDLLPLRNYEKHKRRLEELQSGAKFNIFPGRTQQIQRYRNNKHLTFLKELRDRSSSINKTNVRIFQRLAGTTEAVRNIAEPPVESSSAYLVMRQTSRKRKQEISREHENERMQIRLKSLVSSINTRKINDEYRRSVQIRNRITRYETNPLTHRITPKAQKFIGANSASGSIKLADGRSVASDSKNKPYISAKLGKIPPVSFDKARMESVRTSLAANRKLRQRNISSTSRYRDEPEGELDTERDEPRQAMTARPHDQEHVSDSLFPTQVNPINKARTALKH